MRILRVRHLVTLVMFAACSEGITAPDCDRCDDMRVLTDRSAYRPGSVIAFSITNRTSTELRYDWCSVGLASRGNGDTFPPAQYSPARRCGIGAGARDVLDHLVLIPPGESLRDSVSVSSGASQSLYRVVVWLLDENGTPQQGNPVVSNTFEVFPAAGSSITER